MNTMVGGIAATAEAQIQAWIEERLQGKVLSMERQARWRPCWYVDFEAKSSKARKQLYVRGRRAQAELLFFPLAHEAEVFRVLHEAGIPSPVVYGLCPDPEAIVMDKMPGRANLATAESKAEQESVLLDYMDVLARMHAIPPERFAGAGLTIPTNAAELAFGLFDRFQKIQVANKRRPAPEVMFVMSWLRRNTPTHRTRPAFICADSGQFLFENGKVTSVLDMELGHIGDPCMDLSSLLLRNMTEPLGDLVPGFKRYAEIAGPIDWDVVMYYLTLWGIMTPMVTLHLSQDPPPELDHLYNDEQTIILTRVPLESMAQILKVKLDPMPAPFKQTGQGGSVALQAALKALRGALADVQPTEAFMQYRRNCASEVADYLGILVEQEGQVLAQEREEAAKLLGRDIADEQERNAALEQLAVNAGPDRDEELLRFFYRRIGRREALMGEGKKFFVQRTIDYGKYR